jgi:hypothetical protein
VTADGFSQKIVLNDLSFAYQYLLNNKDVKIVNFPSETCDPRLITEGLRTYAYSDKVY